MSTELVAIICTIVGVGFALGGLIVPGLTILRRDVADLRERMARLEGLFKGFTRRANPPRLPQ